MSDNDKRTDEERKDKNLEETLNEFGENMAKFMESVLEKGEEFLENTGLDDIFSPQDDSSTGTRHDGRANTKTAEPEYREPVVDVFDEEKEIVIYVELPGIDEETLSVNLRKGSIYVMAEAGRDVFEKKITLPAEVSSRPKYHFKNGILKIELKKVKTASKK